MVESYLSVGGESISETIIERSKFITRITRVSGEDEAREFIERVRKTHSDATHNCYAYVASEDGNVIKFSDDGEPQGTAGMPMLDVLRNRKIMMTAAVVTRYFGGVKLGAGGLVRAHSGCVAELLNKSEIVSNELSSEIEAEVSYDLYPLFLKYIVGKKVKVLSSDFSENVSIICVLPRLYEKEFCDGLKDYLLGKVKIEKNKEYFFSY